MTASRSAFRLVSRTPRRALRCPFCHAGAQGHGVACTACRAWQHTECWRLHGTCATCAAPPGRSHPWLEQLAGWLRRARRSRPWAVFSPVTWLRIAVLSPGAILGLLLFVVEDVQGGSEAALGVIAVSWLVGSVTLLKSVSSALGRELHA